MKLIFTLVLSAATFTCLAQKDSAFISKKITDHYFYKKDGVTEVFVKDSAEYIEEVTMPEKGQKLFDVQRFYKDGKLSFTAQSFDDHPLNLQGQAISYYHNGQEKQVTAYDNNRPKGLSRFFYPNGKPYLVMEYQFGPAANSYRGIEIKDTLIRFEYDSAGNVMVEEGKGHFKLYADDFKTVVEEGDVANYKRDGIWKGYDAAYGITFTEKYENGKLIEGNATDAAGNHYTYVKRMAPPEFKGGQIAFNKMLANNVRYPAYSREHDHHGRAIVRVFVSDEGKAQGYLVMQSIDDYIDAEAVRMAKLQPLFTPAVYYGKKVASFKDVPVAFHLNF